MSPYLMLEREGHREGSQGGKITNRLENPWTHAGPGVRKKCGKFKEGRAIAGLYAASCQWSESVDQQQHMSSTKWLFPFHSPTKTLWEKDSLVACPNSWKTNFLSYDSKSRLNKRQDKFYCLKLNKNFIARKKEIWAKLMENYYLKENICSIC